MHVRRYTVCQNEFFAIMIGGSYRYLIVLKSFFGKNFGIFRRELKNIILQKVSLKHARSD